MDVLDVVRDWNIRCAQCGDCKVFNPIFLPCCPPGHRFQFNSYYATGRLMIGRGLSEGALSLEDDDVIERIYTCTACRACDENCGNFPKDHIVDVIQGLRQMALDLKNIATEKVEVVYRAGCLLSLDPEMHGTALDTISLLQQAGVDVGIEGKEEVCCGGRAYEIGQMAEFTKYAEHNIEAYNGAGVSKVVVSCADGLSHLKLLYPKVNKKMNFEVLHMVEYLDQLIKEGRFKFTRQVPMKVTYHDPCHLGRYAEIYDPPRDILKSIPGLELVEMERSREFSWCCGAGAGVKQAYPDFALWTAAERIKEAKETGAEALVTSCPWCEKNFRDAIKEFGESIEVYDIAEIARMAV